MYLTCQLRGSVLVSIKNVFCRIVWDSDKDSTWQEQKQTTPLPLHSVSWIQLSLKNASTPWTTRVNEFNWQDDQPTTMIELPNFFITTLIILQLYEFSRKSRTFGSCCFSSNFCAFKSNAMFVLSNLMHVRSAPAQVHQQPARGVESEFNRTQEYPVSLKLAFCKWKEGFLSGKEEPEWENQTFPVRTRARTWLRFLRSIWNKNSWTEKTKIPCVSTLHNWINALNVAFS